MSFWGALISILKSKKRNARIICVGLDNSGKSTIVNALKSSSKQSEHIVPTVGFSVEKIQSTQVRYNVTDMSGQVDFTFRQVYCTIDLQFVSSSKQL